MDLDLEPLNEAPNSPLKKGGNRGGLTLCNGLFLLIKYGEC